MIEGSCLCGNVTYKIKGKISDIIHCHCGICRKAHGGAFSSVASVSFDCFYLKDESSLAHYESSPGKMRFFCKNCGTQIYARRDEKQNIALSLGAVNSKIPSKQFAHVWVSKGADWYDLNAELPHYEGDWRDGA